MQGAKNEESPMTRQDVLKLIEEMLQIKSGSLRGPEKLKEIEGWDSLSVVDFMALADKHCGLALLGNQVAACKTLDELIDLLGISRPDTIGQGG